MKFHHGLALLAVVAVPVLAGCIAAFEAGYRKRPLTHIALSAITAAAIALIVVVPLANTCSNSHDITLAAPSLLSQDELDSLDSSEMICPTVFHFTRDGQKTCLVSDGDGGASVGCG